MYHDDYFRQWNGPFPFTYAGLKDNVPRGRTGVYQILNGERVLYIGISTPCVRGRLLSHLHGRGNRGVAAFDRRGWTFVFFECDEASARQIESHVTATRKPPFNVKSEYKHYIDNITVH